MLHKLNALECFVKFYTLKFIAYFLEFIDEFGQSYTMFIYKLKLLSQAQALFEYFLSQAQVLMIKARRFIELSSSLAYSFRAKLKPGQARSRLYSITALSEI